MFSGTLVSCSVTGMSPRLSVYRVGDTLQVDLDEATSARWSTTRDSLVIVCENCEVGYTRLVEKFEEDNRAAVYISPYERLRLSLYSSRLDTVIVIEPLFTDTIGVASQERRRIVRTAPRRRATVTPQGRTERVERPATPPANNTVKKEEKVVKKEETVKKRPSSARVTANEGVAVYKDKSKREVLRILPKGTNVPYIAKEGELTSVMVDGQEGFVESEAVRIEE